MPEKDKDTDTDKVKDVARSRERDVAPDTDTHPGSGVAAPSTLLPGSPGRQTLPDDLARSRDAQAAPRCPDCGGEVERYQGANPHKKGTGWCLADGKRVRLEG